MPQSLLGNQLEIRWIPRPDVFSENLAKRLDRESFKFKHKLLGHPALSLENLAKVIPALPKNHVHYSNKMMKNGDSFEQSFQHSNNLSIEETIDSIRVSDSYIMISSPEIDDSFASLYRELITDVETLMQKRGVGTKAIDPKLYLFIASPNSITPFHIDRYSTFLMQFRGSKEICVFNPWDERAVTSIAREAYVAYANTHLPWCLENDVLATKFVFHPGETLHIPFVAGHHVKNGSEDVSISMSIIFNTRQTMMWRKALTFNHSIRPILERFDITPAPVGVHFWRDTAKAYFQRPVSRVTKLLKSSKY
ncbi:transcriptional regulator [Brunnivagina elsteri CCALA 953]|uniref:Transcriptional regulator n=2 Tax=Brunnivagina TaxID=3344733 RepID=A0A2A2TNM4_9CYAN|nr:transcriptional regulator [Calothrix elsteri CCALA 953]